MIYRKLTDHPSRTLETTLRRIITQRHGTEHTLAAQLPIIWVFLFIWSPFSAGGGGGFMLELPYRRFLG